MFTLLRASERMSQVTDRERNNESVSERQSQTDNLKKSALRARVVLRHLPRRSVFKLLPSLTLNHCSLRRLYSIVPRCASSEDFHSSLSFCELPPGHSKYLVLRDSEDT